MSEKCLLRLIGQLQRQRAKQYIDAAPHGWVVRITPETRTLEQNAALWAYLTDVSEQVDWYGNRLTPEEWKAVFSAALKKQKVVPGIDGGFVVCGQSTSRMGKAEFSEMLELIQAFGAQHGVRFSEQKEAA
jgi:hypothetical protein